MPREKILQVRMSEQELKELKAFCDRKGISMSTYARTILKEKLEQAK
jgi:predicted DNA binding CopG/RHH family protein